MSEDEKRRYNLFKKIYNIQSPYKLDQYMSRARVFRSWRTMMREHPFYHVCVYSVNDRIYSSLQSNIKSYIKKWFRVVAKDSWDIMDKLPPWDTVEGAQIDEPK